MTAMVVLMVILILAGGHHGFSSSPDAIPSKAETPHAHMQSDRTVKPDEDKR